MGAGGAFFVSIGPTAIIVIGVQRRRWSDRHLTVREHRRVPLIDAFALRRPSVSSAIPVGPPGGGEPTTDGQRRYRLRLSVLLGHALLGHPRGGANRPAQLGTTE